MPQTERCLITDAIAGRCCECGKRLYAKGLGVHLLRMFIYCEDCCPHCREKTGDAVVKALENYPD